MPDRDFDGDAYLNRIGIARPADPNEDALTAIVRAQSYSIPFENFDILLGRGISLAPADIFKKLVLSPRGGYCFELNGLLLAALRHFGFEARALLARVHLRGPPTGRTHQVLLVALGGRRWIADAGFGGGSPLRPLPLEVDRVFAHDGLAFRLIESDTFGYLLQRQGAGDWLDLYSFDLSHVTDADIVMGNYYTSSHPDCFFTYSRVATIPVERGRVSLEDLTLRQSIAGDEETHELPEGSGYLDALEQYFGIVLNARYEALKPPRLGTPSPE
jgi:N-hydroxyarylamine O-acetyltransferase